MYKSCPTWLYGEKGFEMDFTARDMQVIEGILESLCRMDYRQLNTFLGSETIKEMQNLRLRMKYADYMKEHGVKSLEDMTADDYAAYEEELFWNWYEAE